MAESPAKILRTDESSHTDARPTERGSDFEQIETVPPINTVTSTPLRGISSTVGRNEEEDQLFYKVDKKKYAVIFNNVNFTPRPQYCPKQREGSDVDCERMKTCLTGKLGFSVQDFKDPTQLEIRNAINNLSNMSSSEVSCIMVVVLTHGGEGGVLEAKDVEYKKEIILHPFIKKDTKLSGVPKLFFFQACRGDKVDDGVEQDSPGRKLPIHADIFELYSAVEGNTSYRDTTNGTWMIQAICKQLEKVPCKWHFLELVVFAIGEVARVYESKTSKKGIPQIVSTLTKLLDFSR